MSEPLIMGGFSNFKLLDLNYHLDQVDIENSFIELKLINPSYQLRHLKFIWPTCLCIEEGFRLSGMEINDISSWQWGNSRVQVRNFEQDPGITFLAKEMVVIVDETA